MKKVKFSYKPKNKEMVKQGKSRYANKFDRLLKEEYEVFKPKEGVNKVRLLPGDEDYWGVKVVSHRLGERGFPYACPAKMKGEKCPVCEEYQKARKDGDDEYAKALAPSERLLVWMIDREHESDGPKLWDMPRTLEIEMNSNALDEDTNEILPLDDPLEGYDFRFSRQGKDVTTKYSGFVVSRNESLLSPDEDTLVRWLDFVQDNKLQDTINVYDYAHLKAMLNGEVDSTGEVVSKEENPKDTKGKASVSIKEREEEQEEESSEREHVKVDEEVEEEGDEAEAKPAQDKGNDRLAALRARLANRTKK